MTFWQHSETGKKNNAVAVSPPAGGESYELMVSNELPTKMRNISPVLYQATPSPVKKRASAVPPPPKERISNLNLPVTTAHSAELQCLCNDLEVCLKINSDELAKAEKEKQEAVGSSRRLQQQYENAQQMCTDQFLLHQQLVSELRQRIEEVEDLRQTDASYIDTLEADANREPLPVPRTVDKIPFCLEYITNCASKKGLPLAIKNQVAM
jgi:hypothetical protein